MTGPGPGAPTAVSLPTSDPPPAILRLPHGDLSYVDEGPRDAPALVALHGIPGSVRDFRYLAPQLADRVRFIRVDLPGFGGSAPAEAATDSWSARGRIVLALADHLGLATFGILGHSMGGGTALVLAEEHQPRVRLLVLVASVGLTIHRGLRPSPAALRIVGRGLTLPLLGPLLLRVARAQYRKRRFPGADEMSTATLTAQLRALGACDFERLRRAASAPLPPTILAYAHDDHMVETSISEALAGAIRGSRVLAFAEGGHNLQKTRAPELAAAINEELAGVAPAQ